MLHDYQNKTTEFSFRLKDSKHGVGVFVLHNIKSGAFLRVFGNENNINNVSITRKKEAVPEFFRQYCVDRGDTMECPKDFGCMEVGWFINHSKSPSAYICDKEFYAIRNISTGEEITIDYNSLKEPKEAIEGYYKE